MPNIFPDAMTKPTLADLIFAFPSYESRYVGSQESSVMAVMARPG